jgi:hypothetical protein
MYGFVNAVAALIALIVIETAGFRFGLADTAPAAGRYVVQVVAAVLGSAALLRTSVTLVQDRAHDRADDRADDRRVSMGPISLLHGVLKIVDGAMARKRALARLSGNELEGLSFARDHAALAQLACHALPHFDLAEAQRLGELAADLRTRDDLTDADKLDCFGLELSWLVGERALAKAAARLRSRPVEAGDEHDLGEWWRPDVRRRQSAEPPPLPVGQPRVRGSLARETRLAAPDRSLLDTREDMRRAAEPAEPRPAPDSRSTPDSRPARTSHEGRPLRRSRSAS